jgi:hypothetical protein
VRAVAALVALFAAAGAARPARAAELVAVDAAAPPGPRAARPWAVRGEAFVLSGSGALAAPAASFGVTVQRTLFKRFAWEETIVYAAGNRLLGGRDIGLTLAGTGRGAVWMSAQRTGAVTVAAGTALVLGGAYGTLNFLFGELGYEHRAAAGLTFIIVAGPDLLLSGPARDRCAGCGFKPHGFAPLGHVRMGFGWAF